MVRLYLLGPTLCTGAGEEISTLPRSPKRLALLSYLAVATPPGFHRRDTLYGQLWPESDQQHARAALRQAIHQLRTEIGDAVVTRGRGEVGLDWDRFWCDAVAFREEIEEGRHEQALALYRRDLLEGFYLKGLAEFERWLDQTRVGLRRQAADAAWASADSAPDPTDGARWARRAAGLTPYDESAIRRLIGFLDGQGDRTGALREYERFSRRILDEFGTAPSDETAAMARRIAAAGEDVEPPFAGVSGAVDVVGDAAADVEPFEPQRSTTDAGSIADSDDDRGIRRRRAPLAVAAAVIFLAAMGTVGATLFLERGPRSLDISTPRQLTSDPGIETDPAISPDGGTVVFAVGPESRSHLFARSVGQAGPARPLTGELDGTHRAPAWSPDGKQLAFVTDEGDRSAVQVMTPGGSAIEVYEGPTPLIMEGPSWSPDARRIAFTLGASIMEVSLSTGQVDPVAAGLRPSQLAWSPDGRWIAFVDGNIDVINNTGPSSIWVVSVESGESRLLVRLGNSSFNPVWAHGGRTLYFISDRDGGFELYRVPLSSELELQGDPEKISLDAADVVSASLSADGRRLAFSTYEHRANLWALAIPPDGEGPASLEEGEPVTEGLQVIETADVSPNGRTLVFDSNLSGNADIYALTLDGDGTQRALTASTDHDFAPRFSPDGKEVVFYRYTDGIRHLHVASLDTSHVWQLTDAEDPDAHPDWSPSGNEIVFHRRARATDLGALLVIEREGPEAPWSEPRTIRYQNGETPEWSPDGKWIVFKTGDDVRAMPAAGGPSHVVWEHNGFPRWSSDSRYVYVKTPGPPAAGIWRIPASGGEAELVVSDRRNVSIRSEFAVSAERFYYTIADREADVWIVDLPAPR